MPPEPIIVALRVADVLDQHGIRYVLGGSLASSMSGEPRSTLDVDMVAALSEEQVASVVNALGEEFHADPDGMRHAIREKSSVNLLHLGSSIKVDLFVMGGSPIDEVQMERRRRVKIATDPDRFLYVYTPEDILLQKLRWYRMGDEVSDRQWRDILGIVVVQGAALDLEYVRRSAEILGVEDLLERALDDVRGRLS